MLSQQEPIAVTRDDLSDKAERLLLRLYTRGLARESTSIRNLTAFFDGNQIAALRALAELEFCGLVVVEDELHDAFESQVSLSEAGAHVVSAGDHRRA